MDRIPEEARPLFQTLHARPLEAEAALRERVDAWIDVLYALREERGKDIDLDAAEALADRSRKLLDGVTPVTGEDDRRLIQAAVRYFLDASDARGDLRAGGLGDDVAVMNAVSASLLRTDLLIQ
jgi:hypothetical protein